MRGSSPQGVPSKLAGKRERSVTPQRDRAVPQREEGPHTAKQGVTYDPN
jgi:hypothetical protein